MSQITFIAVLAISPLLLAPPQSEISAVSRQKTQLVEPKNKIYGFVHHETTGTSSYIVINGKQIPIRFRADSDLVAVRSLNALNWKIFLPNSDGTKLFLIGQFFARPKHTSSCEGCSTVEEYREFRLVDWFIITPFEVVRDDCNDCSYLLKTNLQTRHQLELKDFSDFEGRDTIDIRRFQREKKILTRQRTN